MFEWIKYFVRFLLVGIMVFLGQVHARAQSDLRAEYGIPYFLQNYSYEDYRAHPQNWSITQDYRGVIYAGNSDGLLEYDGVNWRLIRMRREVPVRSVATDESGTVYVGAIGDLGRLEPDATGQAQFVSLREYLPESHQEFSDVWAIHAVEDAVYFQTHERIFVWRNEEMQVHSFASQVHTSFVVNGSLFFRQHGVGLVKLTSSGYELIPDGDILADQRVYTVLPYRNGKLLIGTREEGLFVHDGESLSPLESEVNSLLLEYQLYHGCELGDGVYALATLAGGIIVIDEEGNILRIIDESAGLLDQVVFYLFRDRERGLWAALNSGLARVDPLSPLTFFDRRNGLEGSVRSVLRHNGKLYVATSRGVYLKNSDGKTWSDERNEPRFKPVFDTSVISWMLLSVGESLFATTDEGVYKIDLNGSARLFHAGRTNYAHIAQDSSVVFFGRQEGLTFTRRTSEGWSDVRSVRGITEHVRYIIEDKKKRLWVTTLERNLIRLTFDPADLTNPEIHIINQENGLQTGAVAITKVEDELLFVNEDGFHRFDEDDGRTTDSFSFVSGIYPEISAMGADASQRIGVYSDRRDNLWLFGGDEVMKLNLHADGTFEADRVPMLRFPEEDISNIHVETAGIAWLNSNDRLIRYNSNVNHTHFTDFVTLVRTVLIGTDSLLFGGVHATGDGHRVSLSQPEESVPQLAYSDNTLRISYAAPSFVTEGITEYRSFLEGFDRDWSSWTSETRKDYTNLPHGDYRFRVEARNRFGFVSEEGVFAFTIAPPWYKTWWAYGLYFITLISVIVIYGRYRTMVHAAEMTRELARERLVNERLQQANALLQEADRLKDEFLANTSHELRTPLAAILGFASVLREEVSEDHQEFVGLIEESGQRLLHTLNSLLDLAKLRANMIEVRPEIIDVVSEAETCIRLLAPLAEKKEIELTVEASSESAYAVVDRICIERILNNLVGNAIKFTEKGSVTIEIAADDATVSMKVIDTGVGISDDFMPFLFDEFRQQSSGLARLHEGSGLGLAITKRMVDLNNGTITVESEEERGSTFIVVFPRAEEESVEEYQSRIHYISGINDQGQLVSGTFNRE